MQQYATSIVLIVAIVAVALVPSTWVRNILQTFRLEAEQESRLADQAELESLRALVASYPAQTFGELNQNGIVAPVFAAYPLAYHSELLVGAGSDEGVQVGDVAVVRGTAGGVLLGRVSGVGDATSRVQTIFDPSWKSAVRVGTSSIDALLEGGIVPRLTLIPKNAEIVNDDVIFSVDKALPFGLSVGSVESVEEVQTGVLQEANVRVPYDPATLTSVTLLRTAR